MICGMLACENSNFTIVMRLIEDSIFPNILNTIQYILHCTYINNIPNHIGR